MDEGLAEVRAGRVRALFGLPEGSPPFPAVIVLHEAWGLNADIQAISNRFRAAGYAVLVPDLYSLGFKPLCIASTIIDMVRGGRATAELIGETRTWLADRPEVDGGRLGIVGFCMGGGFALAAGVRHDFQAASVNYGRVPAGERALEGICPVVASYGAKDRMLLPHARRLEERLAALGVPHDVKVYPGAGHSFMNKSAPAWLARFGLSYHEEAAADAWERLMRFFEEHVKGAPAT